MANYTNILVVLLLLAVLVMGIGLLNILLTFPGIRITGAATGVTNLTVQSLTSIRMIRNVSEFGSGTVTAGGVLTHLYTNSTNPNGFRNGSEGNGTNYGTGTYVYPFVVENDGNDDTTCVKIRSDKAASTFIGGTNPSPVFEFAAQNNETGACASGLQTAWTTVQTTDSTACQALHTETGGSGANTIRIHWHIGIPSDSPPATKTATITITGSDNC
jgi:hypothetical protein